jgi:hypothetical protein
LEKLGRDRDGLGGDEAGVLEEGIMGSDEKKLKGVVGVGGNSEAGVNGGRTEEDVKRMDTLKGLLGGKTE